MHKRYQTLFGSSHFFCCSFGTTVHALHPPQQTIATEGMLPPTSPLQGTRGRGRGKKGGVKR